MHIQYAYDHSQQQRVPFHDQELVYNNRSGHKRTGKSVRDNSSAIELTQLPNSGGRRNSASSSYHQNTGDSGMSAGIGCSTEHNSSNSNASSGGNTLPKNTAPHSCNEQAMKNNCSNYENITPNALRQARELAENYDSTTPSRVSQQSGYMSTVSSCWQYEPQQPQFKPAPPPRSGPIQMQHTNHERSSDFPGT